MPEGWRPADRGELDGSQDVVIACTLRSGSNLVCDMLRANGFGAPREWFQAAAGVRPGTQDNAPDGSRLERQTLAFLAAHAGQKWRGVKFDWLQFRDLRACAAGVPTAERLLAKLQAGHWLYLSRRNLAAQAVSLFAAQTTGAWMGEATGDHEHLPTDFDAIYERFAAIAAGAFAWEAFFRASGIVPHRLHYEDLIDGGAPAWSDLLCHLAPDFDPHLLDLDPLRSPPREHRRLREVKDWFELEMLAGRQPRSLLTVLEEIGSAVARVERVPSVQTVLGRFAADMVASRAGFRLRKLDLSGDLSFDGPATLVEQGHFLDGVALRLGAGAGCGFTAAASRFMLQFHAHAWSGVAEIGFGDVTERLDLFSERSELRHFVRDLPPGFSGVVGIRATGDRHLLSGGAEVWLQRVFVLGAGSQ